MTRGCVIVVDQVYELESLGKKIDVATKELESQKPFLVPSVDAYSLRFLFSFSWSYSLEVYSYVANSSKYLCRNANDVCNICRGDQILCARRHRSVEQAELVIDKIG